MPSGVAVFTFCISPHANCLQHLQYTVVVKRVIVTAGIPRTREPSGWRQEEPAVARQP